MTVSVLIADDHLVIRQGLRLLLELDPELDVVGEVGDGREAVYLACQLRPDLVLMDLVMPEMNGLTATAEIRRQLPDTQMLILTGIVDDDAIVECVRAGAIGYLRKDIEIDDLCRAIKRVAAGEAQLAPDAVARLLREV
jgi:DNA-binding NarL/FixJ family response regulator